MRHIRRRGCWSCAFLQLAACFLLVGLLTSRAAWGQDRRPNVVLVMADDQGWGDVGFNGSKTAQTPHLDEMARQGLQFERFYAAAPVCSPTRGSMLTGRHPYRYGIFYANVGHLPDEEWTLAELLKREGYRTGLFGKWHLGTLTKVVREANRGGPRGRAHYAPPWEHGFDETFASESKMPTYDPLLKPKEARRTWWEPVAEGTGAAYETYYWKGQGQVATENLRGDDSRVIMDRALPFIEQSAESDRPFLAVIWFHAPHLPVVADSEHTRLFPGRDPYTRHYYGSISALDEQVGRLRGKLRELGVAENTLLWFTSDNGPEHWPDNAPGSSGPFRGTKRSLHEGGIRVPTVMEWPGRIEGGATTNVPAVTSDVLPTVLDALALSPPRDRPLDGISLLPLMDGEMDRRPQPIAFASRGQLALSDNRYKLIHVPEEEASGPFAKENPSFELYDLKADPAEENNLAQEKPQIVRRMKARLQRWRESVKDSRNGEDYAHR